MNPIARFIAVAAILSPLWGASPEAKTSSPDVRGTTRVERQIRNELVTLPQYGVFDHIEFRVEGSKVVLMGEVNEPTLKTSAEKVAKNVEGITQVDNQLEVLPVSAHDDAVRRAVYDAVYSHPSLQRYQLRSVPPIHIIVKNGAVSLEGVVASDGDKNIANIQANTVPGVFGVKNNLRVEES